mmetsp:Transcript_8295/g.22847  ORF Transcript_8295/g.22847 Transcript_8295/m.22847 type:complete len:306 (-) Transcript_8295:148-1065(-)
MALLRLAAPPLLPLLHLMLRTCPAACYPTAAPVIQAQNQPSEDAFGADEADHETVDIQSVLAALGLLSGTFLAVLVGLRVYLHCMRRRPARREHRKKMTEADIEKRFPVTKTEGGETCVVCLANIEVGDDCRVTQCGHTFHAECLLSWWLYKPRRVLRCPICRTRQRSKPRKAAGGEAGSPDALGGEAAEASPSEGTPQAASLNCGEGEGAGAQDVRPLQLPLPITEADEKREESKRDSEDSSLDEHSGDVDKAEAVVGIVVLASPRMVSVKLEVARGDFDVEDVELNSDIAGNGTREVAAIACV